MPLRASRRWRRACSRRPPCRPPRPRGRARRGRARRGRRRTTWALPPRRRPRRAGRARASRCAALVAQRGSLDRRSKISRQVGRAPEAVARLHELLARPARRCRGPWRGARRGSSRWRCGAGPGPGTSTRRRAGSRCPGGRRHGPQGGCAPATRRGRPPGPGRTSSSMAWPGRVANSLVRRVRAGPSRPRSGRRSSGRAGRWRTRRAGPPRCGRPQCLPRGAGRAVSSMPGRRAGG